MKTDKQKAIEEKPKITFIVGGKGAGQTAKATAWYENRLYSIQNELSKFELIRLYNFEVIIFDNLGNLDDDKIQTILEIVKTKNIPDVIFVCESTGGLFGILMDNGINFNIVPCKKFNPINN